MTKYDGYNFSQTWRCYEEGCEFSGMEHDGGHPQAKAHHKKTGHVTGVVQQHEFYYGYQDDPVKDQVALRVKEAEERANPTTPNKRSE